jgi:CrcB protein
MLKVLALFVGGGLGSVFRYGISRLTNSTLPNLSLPISTLVANVVSCIVMAVILLYYPAKVVGDTWMRMLLLVGFCGGLSTFSTFSFEIFQLIKEGQVVWAIANILISISLCLLVFYLGYSKLNFK